MMDMLIMLCTLEQIPDRFTYHTSFCPYICGKTPHIGTLLKTFVFIRAATSVPLRSTSPGVLAFAAVCLLKSWDAWRMDTE